jgi:hypothetical protein
VTRGVGTSEICDAHVRIHGGRGET